MAILTVAVFLVSCTLVLRSLDARLEPPGELYWVDGDKYLVHAYCRGNKTDSKGVELPTVLLEGGEGTVEDSLWSFADDAVNNGSISRYCFVDRPGLAWVSTDCWNIRVNANLRQSDTAPSPLSAGMAVEAVSEALAKAGEGGPWGKYNSK